MINNPFHMFAFILLNLSMRFKCSSVWFYFLMKCSKEEKKKPAGKKLNVDRQIFHDVICNVHFLMVLSET